MGSTWRIASKFKKVKMQITELMLSAAMLEARAAGLFHRHCSPLELELNKQVMHSVLNAALSVERMKLVTLDLPDDSLMHGT